MTSNNKTDFNKIILIVAPLLVTLAIQVFVSFVDMIILLAQNAIKEVSPNHGDTSFHLNDAYASTENLANMTIAWYVMYIIVFGIWYYKSFVKPAFQAEAVSTKSIRFESLKTLGLAIKRAFVPRYIIFLLIFAGYASQMMTSAVLTMAGRHFPDAFSSYGEQVTERVLGSESSLVMLIAVFFLAPIGEELIFRGLTLRYSKNEYGVVLACILNGILFAFYHGNLIQGVYAFIFGTLLAFLAVTSGSILPGILFHISVNCSALLAYTLLASDKFFKNDTACVISFIAFLLLSAGSLYIILRTIRRTDL